MYGTTQTVSRSSPSFFVILHLVETGFSTPAELLACDEALLDLANSGAEQTPSDSGGFLRFWESPTCFVVLGYSKKMAEEVHWKECRETGVPIFRRCTGGGTVLQGRGCLNYSLVLPVTAHAELATITSTNCFIMRQQARALSDLLGQQVEVKGHTDLVLGDMKFSGNAQRRKSRALMFHGSILYDFDLDLVERLLQMPRQRPEYRVDRTHRDFIRNIPAARAELEAAISEVWKSVFNWKTTDGMGQTENVESLVVDRTAALAREKYSREEWNHRF